MKKSTLIILAVLFVAVLVAAVLLYPKLRDSYTENIAVQTDSEPVSADLSGDLSGDLSADLAADFTVYDENEKAVKLSDFRGTPTIVNFWATWCYYCVQELPDFNKLYEEYKDKVNFVMVDLVDGYSETKDSALAFKKENGYSFPVYFDNEGSASEAYTITGIPMTLVVDRDGKLYKIHTGFMNESTLRAYIEAITE